MPKTRWPREPRQFRWIVDGHNAIFAHPDLEALQTGGEKAQARRRLEGFLERFAALFRLEVTIVYDGNRSEGNPDQRRGGLVRSLYSLSPHEEADDRIVLLCTEWRREGRKVAVVSSDRATLGARLPSGVIQVTPAELFDRLERGVARSADARPQGEAHFLSLEQEGPPHARARADEPERKPTGRSGRRRK
jgi:predicted RNA-binding protein with PIN domain